MATYSASIQSVAAAGTTNDLITLVPAANRRIWVTECSVGGLGTASAASVINLYPITAAGSVGTGAVTPKPFDFYGPTAASTVSTLWTTQPVVGAVPWVTLSVNANGGLYRWVARPGQEINIIGGLAGFLGLSVRCSLAGGSNYCVTLTWIEDPI